MTRYFVIHGNDGVILRSVADHDYNQLTFAEINKLKRFYNCEEITESTFNALMEFSESKKQLTFNEYI